MSAADHVPTAHGGPTVATSEAALLDIRNVTVLYGGVAALSDFSLQVPVGGRVGLIGPNGAGKSTAVNVISGYVKASGTLRFDGHDLGHMSSRARAGIGIGRTFQNLELFSSLTILENVSLGLMPVGLAAVTGMVSGRGRRAAKATSEEAMTVLRHFGIGAYGSEKVVTVPYGVRKLVEVCRALVQKPRLLVLDEPAAGLMTGEKRELAGRLHAWADETGMAMLLIEHDMETVQSLCDYVYVIDFGATIASGRFDEVASDPAVISAYLGGRGEEDDNETRGDIDG